MPHRLEPPLRGRTGHEPGGLLLAVVERWTLMATQRPWQYAATWAIGIGAANFGLRMVLNTLPAWQNALWATLVVLVFFTGVGLSTSWLTRRPRRPDPDRGIASMPRRTTGTGARPPGRRRHGIGMRGAGSSGPHPHRRPGTGGDRAP